MITVAVVVLLFANSLLASGEQRNSVSCVKHCDNVYVSDKQADVDSWFACHRGCRIYNLIEFSFQKDAEESAIRSECRNACSEAYSDERLNKSCSFGCDHQKSLRGTFNLLESPLEEKQWSVWPFQPFKFESFFGDDEKSPFQLFNSILNKLRSPSFWAHSKPSVTLYTQGSDGNVKVIHYKSEAFQTQTAANAPEVVVHSYSAIENGDVSDLKNDVSVKEIEVKSEKQKHHHSRSELHRKSWFSCFAYQTIGVPRWFLVFTLFSLILGLAWICCLSTATAPTQRIKRHFGFGNVLPFVILREDGNPVQTPKDDIYWKIFGSRSDLKSPLNVIESPPTYDEASKETAKLASEPVVTKS